MVASSSRPYTFHPEARAETGADTRWYRVRDPRVSLRFVADIRLAIERACLMPESYPEYLHGTRKANVGAFPYLMVFRENHGRIEIVAVAHASRRPGYWRERLDDEI